MLLTFSLIALFVGIAGTTCGCAPCATGNRVYPVLFGIPLMMVWLVFLIMGSVVTGVSTTSQDTLQEFCDGDAPDSVMWLSNTINAVDEAVNSYSGQLMCSEYCPCPSELVQPWKQLGESVLNNYNRTLIPANARSLQALSAQVVYTSGGQDYYRIVDRPKSTATTSNPLYE